MKIATWNIYWLGDRTGDHVVRSPEDEQVIAQVIAQLAPDVLALQEIVDPLVMERILGMASGPGRDYVMRAGEAWLTSDPDPMAEENLQKAFLCINRETVEFLRGAVISGGPEKYVRQPYAAVLRHRASGHEFLAVTVHLRAGYPAFLDETDAQVRTQEATALAKWLQGEAVPENPDFPQPEHEEWLVLGDFNAELQDPNHSLDPLALPGWTCHNPEPDGNHWETAMFEGDRYVIDLILLSPEMAARVESPPAIYAWDHDQALGGPDRFHLGPDGSGSLRNYRVSDHRPVWVEVAM
jgi:endonuclease/exonuclease/phosphatase family metal-dependent hydrolase